jgi:hypothetical protein
MLFSAILLQGCCRHWTLSFEQLQQKQLLLPSYCWHSLLVKPPPASTLSVGLLPE